MYPSGVVSFPVRVNGMGSDSLIQAEHYNLIRNELLQIQSVVGRSPLWNNTRRVCLVTFTEPSVVANLRRSGNNRYPIYETVVNVPSGHPSYPILLGVAQNKYPDAIWYYIRLYTIGQTLPNHCTITSERPRVLYTNQNVRITIQFGMNFYFTSNPPNTIQVNVNILAAVMVEWP